MSEKDLKILNFIKNIGSVSAPAVAKHFRISRQTATLHLRRLVAEQKLVKSGSTRLARYHVSARPQQPMAAKLKLVKRLSNLQEHKVFDEVSLKLNLKAALGKNVFDIANYSFCEMLNNAIDHSRSKNASIEVSLEKGNFSFTIRDEGIGVFKNVQKHFTLADEYEASEHLYKGKQTTDPKNHSGQGIFFTSRIADVFILRSHKLVTEINNLKEDLYYKEERYLEGTQVQFQIKSRSRKKLDGLFKTFANEDFEFDKNRVRVRLSERESLMSRSQARRLLMGLDKYDRIEFDFNRVKGIGQAFADEIFRVFQNSHPKIQITYDNVAPAVEFMIRRAKTSK